MRYKPVHTFRVPIWQRPYSWVSVQFWRTLTEMRATLGPLGHRGRYEAICMQPARDKGELAIIHLSLTRMTPEAISHESFHAISHIARLADLCHQEDEETLARLLDGIVGKINEHFLRLNKQPL